MKLGDFGQQNSEGNDQTDHVMPASTGLHQRFAYRAVDRDRCVNRD